MYYQRTLKESVECGGIGLHSGRKVILRLHPSGEDTGIVFRRTDLGGAEIPADAEHVRRVDFATTLGDGRAEVKTVEHLLGAFYGMGIDNALVEIDAAEVPIMDGSAAPFVYLIQKAGLTDQGRSRRLLRVVNPMEVRDGDRWIKLLPSNDFRVTYSVQYQHPLIWEQTLTIPMNEATFQDQVAPARTFGFMKDIEKLRVNGLTLGGSIDNAVVLDESKVLNGHLRFENEFVRHKILDVLGDLSLSGFPLKAHVIVHKGGHGIHTEMARLLMSSTAVNVLEAPREEWTPALETAPPFA